MYVENENLFKVDIELLVKQKYWNKLKHENLYVVWLVEFIKYKLIKKIITVLSYVLMRTFCNELLS